MGRNAFLNPSDSRLKAHGFVASNDPGDVVLPVAENFALDPADGWKWDGSAFVSFPFLPKPDVSGVVADLTVAVAQPGQPRGTMALFVQSLQEQRYADADAELDRLTARGIIKQAQHDAIADICLARHIPGTWDHTVVPLDPSTAVASALAAIPGPPTNPTIPQIADALRAMRDEGYV